MTKSQELIKKATDEGKMPLPFLKPAIQQKNEKGNNVVVGTGPHKVKFISDRVINGRDFKTKVERLEMEYTFEEDGTKKRYSVALKNDNGEPHYFIQRMAEVESGDTITLEYKRDGLKGFIDVDRVLGKASGDGIPIIEEDEGMKDEPEEEVDPPEQRKEPRKVAPLVEGGEIDVSEIPF